MRTKTLSSLRCFGLALTAAVCLTACPPAAEQKPDKPATGGGSDGPVAVTTLEARSNSTVKGQATFTQAGDKVKILVEVSGATPGQHGLHVHENGDCSAPDAKSAGGHFNPDGKPHGPQNAPHHAGDMPPLKADVAEMLDPARNGTIRRRAVSYIHFASSHVAARCLSLNTGRTPPSRRNTSTTCWKNS